MFLTKIELCVENTVAKMTEAAQDNLGEARGYAAPELHVVGQAGELVQGNFGYTSSDLTYYRN